jgi:hypothetical protein
MPPGRGVARSSHCGNLEICKSGATTPGTIRIKGGFTGVNGRGLTVLAGKAG